MESQIYRLVSRIELAAQKKSVGPEEAEMVYVLIENAKQVGVNGIEYFFWLQAESPEWLNLLREAIANCPDMIQLKNGSWRTPLWPAEPYMRRMVGKKPDDVGEILEGIDSNNANYLETVCRHVAQNPKSANAALVNRIKDYIISPYQFGSQPALDAMNAIIESGESELAIPILEAALQFIPDPEQSKKESMGRELYYLRSLAPRTHIDSWEYSEMLSTNVMALARKEPHAVINLLCREIDRLVSLKFHSDQLDENGNDDMSRIWCSNLAEQTGSTLDADEAIVIALAQVCQDALERHKLTPDEIHKALTSSKWMIFRRIEHYVYSKFCNEASLPYIRNIILKYSGYGSEQYSYELNRMIRSACEQFGDNLLSEGEFSNIYERIKSGLNKEKYRQQMGECYKERFYKQRKQALRISQLTPFQTILDEEQRAYFQRVSEGERIFSDEDYLLYRTGETRTGSRRSPYSMSELQVMSDEELLVTLNEWNNPHEDPKEWWVTVDFHSLGEAFEQLLKEHVFHDSERLKFWVQNIQRLTRPIYVRRILEALRVDYSPSSIEAGLQLSEWILDRENTAESETDANDKNDKKPSWASCRRSVQDFVSDCVSEPKGLSIDHREQVAALLYNLCNGYDVDLDRNIDLLNQVKDWAQSGINMTRSRSLETLIGFGRWVRRNSGETAQIDDFWIILSNRLKGGPLPIQPEEYAILGMHFNTLCWLGAEKTKELIPLLFVETTNRAEHSNYAWEAAFTSYLKFNRPNASVFDEVGLSVQFETALTFLGHLDEPEKERRKQLLAKLGEHLFLYYVWGVIEINEDSLLLKFYELTDSNQVARRQLFEYVGRTLKNSGPSLDSEYLDRVEKFYEWRKTNSCAFEMAGFTSWIQAECLDQVWRLKRLLEVLEITSEEDDYRMSVVQKSLLDDFFPEHLQLVVQVILKITEVGLGKERYYVRQEAIKPILIAALKSDDPQVQSDASTARDNLLKAGRFEFLQLEGE